MKLLAAHDGIHPRTVIRDLYDIEFIVRNYSSQILPEIVTRLKSFATASEDLASRYEQAYLVDTLVNDRIALDELVLKLHENIRFMTRQEF